MKICIALITLAALILSTHGFELRRMRDVTAAHGECEATIKPPAELAAQFRALIFPQHPTTACYIQCLLKQLQMFDDEKGVLMDNLKAQLTNLHPEGAAQVSDTLAKCLSENPAAENVAKCDWVAKNFLCVLKDNRDNLYQSFLH